MKWDSAKGEEPDECLEDRLGDADQRGRQGRADGRAQELRKGQDAAGQDQDDEGRDEPIL